MKNRIISLLISAIMFVTAFSLPLTAVADTTPAGVGDGTEQGVQQTYDITQAQIIFDKVSYEYTGSEIVPDITVMLGEEELIEDEHYTVELTNNIDIGTATVTIKGLAPYDGEISKTFDITKLDISAAVVETQYASYAFNKKAIKPAVTVTLGEKVLVAGQDYTVSYSNNIYPGTAKATVTGKGDYSGTVTKNFYIAQAANVRVKAVGTNYVTVAWNKSSYVTGYKLYRYSSGKWKLVKTIKGNKNTSYKVKKLGAGYGYRYAVRTYYKKGAKTYYGPYSTTLYAATKPSQGQISSISQDALLKMTIRWKQKQGTGYQVRVATNSKFSNATVYKIEGKTSTSKLVEGLTEGRTYYVQVRAYRVYYDKTTYGAWSKAVKTKASGTGWVNSDGKKYYYVKGVPFKGTRTINGSKYYFDSVTGEWRGGSSTMWNKIKDQSSNTKYLIAMSRDMNRVVVYTGSQGNWRPLYYWKCTDGAKATKTPGGSFLTPTTKPRLSYIGGHITYTCWYATRITGAIYFHSVLYYPRSKTRIQDGRLGTSASHGCIRLSLTNAKWIYDNINPGTRVVIY